MRHSLLMDVELVDGHWVVVAPWLDDPVVAATWQEAYDEALRARSQRRS